MEPNKHIIIFSHGFGVRKDDRGLLTDIAKAFPSSVSYLFDYFDIDEENMTMTIRPFTEQVKILKNVYSKAKETYPDGIIDIIAHSQGVLIPLLANLKGIRKTILLTPPFDMSLERTFKKYESRPGVEINLEGISRLSTLDGYDRFVPKEYWVERKALNPSRLCNEYSLNNEITVVIANQDTILGNIDTSLLNSNIKILNLDGDHGFYGEAREHVIKIIKEELEK